jgi:hypothetical protein
MERFMKKSVFSIGTVVVLTAVFFSCAEAAFDEKAVTYDDKGRRLVEFSIPTKDYDASGGGGIRALSPEVAKAGYNYIEVVFTAHGVGYKSGSAIKGEDIKFSLPEGQYLAVMFAGTSSGAKLLAIGVPTAVYEGVDEEGELIDAATTPDGAGHLDVTINTKTIVFTLTALTAGVERESAVGPRNSFHITAPEEFATDVPSGYYKVDNIETPFFKVPSRLGYVPVQEVDEEGRPLWGVTFEDFLVYQNSGTYYNASDDSEYTGEEDMLYPQYRDVDPETDELQIKGTLNIGGFGDIPNFHNGDLHNSEAIFGVISGSIKSMGISAYDPVTKVTIYPMDVTGRIEASDVYIDKEEERGEDYNPNYGDLVIPFGISTGIKYAFDNSIGFSMIRFDIQVQAFYGRDGYEGIDTTGDRGSVWHISNGLEPGAFDFGDKSIGQSILLSIGTDPNGQIITTEWSGGK